MISSTAAWGSVTSSKNTFFRLLAALIKACMGEVIMTAPNVPPSTTIAAVIWVTSETLPPSITNPPMMPPAATMIPRMLAMSGREARRLDLPAAFFSAIGPRLSCFRMDRRIRSRSQIGWARLIAKQALAERDNPLNDFLGGLQNHVFLPRRQRDHGIRRDLDVFD